MSQLRFPAGLDAEHFLDSYWQQRPLLMRQALPELATPLAADELAGLACEPEVESRLIIEHGDPPWQVRHGPFDDADFAALPETHWTLLVQDVDKYVPAAAALLDAFDFLPRWRLDDVMVSYAPDQGTVGPHLDAYDVFLVQTHGRRRWRIAEHHYDDDDLVPGLDLKILRHFETAQEWLLEPGDVLYLPPGIAHWGIAEGDCMTCSVGFRSPSQAELAAGWLEHLLGRCDDKRRYADPRPLPASLGGEISDPVLDQVGDLLERLRDWPREELAAWFGAYITEPKPHLHPEAPAVPITASALQAGLAAGERIRAHPWARMAIVRSPSPVLYVDGQPHLPPRLDNGIEALAAGRAAGLGDLSAESLPLLVNLYNHGSLIWDNQDDELSD